MFRPNSPEQRLRLGRDSNSMADRHQPQAQGLSKSLADTILSDIKFNLNRYLDVSHPAPPAGFRPVDTIYEYHGESRMGSLLREFDGHFEEAPKISHPLQLPDVEVKGRITDVQSEPDLEKELHLLYLIDDILNNIIRLQPDHQTCETISQLLPQLLLLFTMRGYHRTKIPAKVGMWLFIEQKRQ
jgi:hypothetical protein